MSHLLFKFVVKNILVKQLMGLDHDGTTIKTVTGHS